MNKELELIAENLHFIGEILYLIAKQYLHHEGRESLNSESRLHGKKIDEIWRRDE